MFRRRGIPIGGRLGLLLVAAVLPLATLSAVYAWLAGETARQAELRARYEAARVVAGTVAGVVEGAGRATDFLLRVDDVFSDPEVCREALQRLLTVVEPIADASLFVGDRRVCGLLRREDATTDIAGASPDPRTLADAVVALGAAGQPNIRLVRHADGASTPSSAVVHVRLEPIWRRITSTVAEFGSGQVFLLTEVGGVISDPGGLVPTSSVSAVIAAVNQRDGVGGIPVYPVDAPGIGFISIARVADTSLRVAIATEGEALPRNLPLRIAMVALVPALFLAAAVGIAWFGVDRLVNRWVRRLGRATRVYGEGDLSARVGPMPDAAEEFRALGESFDSMAARIEGRSFELEHALNEKAHFVRELHHRVKNNFQMIASLLTLQRREADGATEAAIREAHDRVQALAAAYRASYADGETGSVPLGALLVDLVERLRESANLSSRVVAFEIAPEPISMHLDRAIPFALLMTELLVPLLGQADDDEEAIRIEAGWADASHATVCTRMVTALDTAPSDRPLSDRLARAYAAQLGATIERAAGSIDVRLPYSG